MITITDYLNELLITNALGSFGALRTTYAALYTAISPSLSHASVEADITEPTMASPAYARQAVTWQSYTDSPSNAYKTVSQVLKWVGDASVPQTIIGVALMTALTGGDLLFAEQFSDPQQLNSGNDACEVVLRYVQGNADDTGSTIVVE